MIKYLALVVVLMASVAYGQDAKVIQLSASDSAKASEKYAALQKAQKDWDEFQESIRRTYIAPLTKEKGAQTVIAMGNGQPDIPIEWEYFTFDKTFRFIVPKLGAISTSGSLYSYPLGPITSH